LALRYLNPLRTHLSVITLIALLGVAVGVLVLVVVMSVMAGFEREVKSRILGFTPHLVVRSVTDGMLAEMTEWNEVSEKVAQGEGVVESYAFVSDNTILDFRGFQSPVQFRAVDTQNKAQMEALETLIDKEKYGGTAEMGLDEKTVVSEATAKRFGIQVGDTIQLYSTRNFEGVFRAYKLTEEPPVAVAYQEDFAGMLVVLGEARTLTEEAEVYVFGEIERVYNLLGELALRNIRPGEREILAEIQGVLVDGETSEGTKILPKGTLEKVTGMFASFGELDMEREDARVLKDIRELVLPKDMEVVGIYKASKRVVHPDIFVPLPTGQELKGIYDGVDGIGVWTTDAYTAGETKLGVEKALGPQYYVETWMSQQEGFFNLIATERLMMYFALSFILLVSAFCICGIMFTVTILKKQEIGVMKALGARPAQIVWVFFYQGMMIGLMGAGLGVALGLLVVRFRGAVQDTLRNVGFDPFPAEFHEIDTIPALVNPTEVGLIAFGAFVLCSLAGLIPALFAAWKDAAKSLRNF